MRLVEIRDFAKDRIEDTAFWTDVKLNALANDCLRSILSFFSITRVKAEDSINTVSGTMSYELPSDYIETHLLYNDTDNTPLQMVDDPNMIHSRVSDVTQSGRPILAYFWGTSSIEELRLYPVPDAAYAIRHLYWSTGANLVNDDDSPMISREQHQHIVEYLIRKIRSEDQESLAADRAFDSWWGGMLLQMKATNNAKTAERRDAAPDDGRNLFLYNSPDGLPIPFGLSSTTYRW